MAKKVDSKVVEMRFENGQFEKSIQTSINSLDKLKASLNFKDTTKSFNEFEQGMGSNGQLAKSIDALTSKFSTMGIVGMTVVNRLTNAAIDAAKQISSFATSGVVSGGWSRAANIENAKFELEGLGVAWNRVKDSIDYGVKDTAYGLDSAAKAAAQLVATQVNVGEEMSTALRAISGVAAMTNSTYDEIANVFVSIAGIRKVTKGELNRLSIRGINAQAELAKYLGKSMSEIDDMISKGKISFKEFAAAMDESFGEHAKDANRTFDGALSNVRAALARTGEGFAEAIREAGKDSLNAIRPMINALNNEIKPIVDDFTGVVEHLSLKVQYIAGKIADSKILANVISTIRNGFYDILMLIMPIVDGFNMIFPPKTTYQMMKSFESLTETIANFVSKAYISREAAANLRDTFSGFFSVIDIVLKFFKALIEVFTPLPIDLLSIGDGFLSVTGVLGRFVRAIDEYLTRNNTFVETFTTIKNAIQPLVDAFAYVFNVIIDGLMTFGRSLKEFDFGKSARDMSLLEGVMGALSAIGETFFKAFRVVGDVFELIWPRIKDAAIIIKGSLDQIFDAFHDALTGNGFEGMMMLIDSMAAAGVSLSAFDLFDVIKSRIKNLPNMLANINTIVFQLKQTLIIFQEAVKADVIMTTAKAVGIMAASLIGLSLVPMKDLVSRLVVLGSVVAMLVVAMKFLLQPLQEIRTIVYGTGWKGTLGSFVAELGKLATRFLEMGAITFVIKEFAIAVGILSASLFALSMTDPTRLFISLIAVVTLMGTLTLMAEHLSKLDNPKLMMGKLVLVAVAVAILGKSIRAFEGAKWGDILKGLAAYAGIFTILGVFMKQVAKLNSTGVELIIQSVASSMIKFAIAIGIISLAFKAFQGMNIQEIINAVIAIGDAMVLMAGFTLFMKTFEISDDFARLAPTFLLFSASLVVLAGAFKAFRGINIQEIINAVIAIGDAMVLMAGFTLFAKTFKIMGDLLPAAGAILVFAAAMTVLGVAFHIFAAIPVEKLGYALVTFALVLAGMVVTFHTLKGVLPEMLGLAGTILAIGAATLMAGGGILLMATALGMVAMLPISQNAEQLIAFAGALGLILGVTIAFAVVSKVAWQTLLALGGAFALIGVGVLAAGAGIAILTMGIQGLVAMAAAGGQTMAVLNTIFKGFIQTAVITTALMTALIFVITKMGIAATPAIPGLLAIGGAIALIGVGILAAGAGVNLFAKSLALIGRYAQEGAVGMAVLTPFIAQFGAALLVVGAAVGLVAIDLFSLAAAGIACIPAAVGVLAMGLALLALDAGVALAAEALDKLIESIKKVKEIFEGSEDIGSMFVQGLINGILNGIPNAIKAGLSLAQAVMSAVTGKSGFDEHSPSIPGWLAGVFYGKGTAGGLLSTLGINAAAGTEIAQVTMDNYESGMDGAVELGEEKGEDMAEGTVSGYQRFLGQGRTKKIVYDEGFKLADTTAEGTKDGWESNTSSFEDIMEQFGLAGEGQIDASNSRILDSADEAAERYKLTWFNAMKEVEGNFSADWGSALSQAHTNDQYNAIKKAAEAEGYFTWLEQQNTKATDDNTEAIDKNTGSTSKNTEDTEKLQKAQEALATSTQVLLHHYTDFYEQLGKTVDAEKAQKALENLKMTVEEFGDYYESVGKKIDSALENVFDTPKEREWMDKNAIAKNMRENLNQVSQWAHEMGELSKRGLSDGVYKYLSEMGPEGYKYVHAFGEMTEDEIANINVMWEEKLQLSTAAKNRVAGGFLNTGVMAMEGLVQGINDPERLATVINTIGEAGLNAIREKWGIHSPSEEFKQLGQFAIAGLNLGLYEGVEGPGGVVFAIQLIASRIVTEFELAANSERLKTVGSKMIATIISGMYASVETLDAIILEVIDRVALAIENRSAEINQNGRFICKHLVTGFREEMLLQMVEIDAAIDEMVQEIVDRFTSKDHEKMYIKMVEFFVKTICDEIINAKTTYKKFEETFEELFTWMFDEILMSEDRYETFVSAGAYWMEGLAQGIMDNAEAAYAAAREVAENVAKITMSGLEEKSPSKLAKKIGKWWDEGLEIGIKGGAEGVYSATTALTDGVVNVANISQPKVRKAFTKMFNGLEQISTKKVAKTLAKITNQVTAWKISDTVVEAIMPAGQAIDSLSDRVTKKAKNISVKVDATVRDVQKRLNQAIKFANKLDTNIKNYTGIDTLVKKLDKIKKFYNDFEKVPPKITTFLKNLQKEMKPTNNLMDHYLETMIGTNETHSDLTETTNSARKAFLEFGAAILNNTQAGEEYAQALEDVANAEEALSAAEEKGEGIGEAEEALAAAEAKLTSYTKAVSKAVKEFKNTIRDNLIGGINPLEGLTFGTDLSSANSILGNTKSYENAYKKWGDTLKELALKGMPSDIMQTLLEKGIDGIDETLTYNQLSDKQIAIMQLMREKAEEQAKKTAKDAVSAGIYSYSDEAKKHRQEIVDSFNMGDRVWMEMWDGGLDALNNFVEKYKYGLETVLDDTNSTTYQIGDIVYRVVNNTLIPTEEDFLHLMENLSDEMKDMNPILDQLGKRFLGVADYSKEMTLSALDNRVAILQMADSLGMVQDAAESTESYIKRCTNAIVEWRDSIKETVESQMNPFEKFNTDFELTGSELLDNMQSNLTGIENWASNIETLAERGMSSALLKYLAELGPASAEMVNAFVSMTDSQLGEANDMWEKILKIPDDVSTRVAAALGETATDMGKAAQEGLAKAFELEGSVRFPYGDSSSEESQAAVEAAGETGYEAGSMIVSEEANALNDGMPTIIEAVSRNASAVTDAFSDAVSSSSITTSVSSSISDGVSAGVNQAVSTSTSAITSAMRTLSSEIVRIFEECAKNSSSAVVNKFQEAVNKIKDMINTIPKNIDIKVTMDTSEAEYNLNRLDTAIDDLNYKIQQLNKAAQSAATSVNSSSSSSTVRNAAATTASTTSTGSSGTNATVNVYQDFTTTNFSRSTMYRAAKSDWTEAVMEVFG